MTVHAGKHVHLEMRGDRFVLYTDGSQQRIELLYGAADEIIEHLSRVMASPQYREAKPPPPGRPDGHLVNRQRMLRKSGGGRMRLRPICAGCGDAINDSSMAELSQREMNDLLCASCYLTIRNKLYPAGRPCGPTQEEGEDD